MPSLGNPEPTMELETKPVDVAELRKNLDGKAGRAYWRGLEELAATPEFEAWMSDEFPNRSSLMNIDRRKLLKFMGASMMLAGLSGCRAPFWPNHKMVPYVNMPEEMLSGKPLQFATGMQWQGMMVPIVVESNEGRPTRAEGNDLDPTGKGASLPFMHADLLNLYDPDRMREVRRKGQIATWDEFSVESAEALKSIRAAQGRGFAILMPPTNSPTMNRVLNEVAATMPEARIVAWEPMNRDNAYQGTRLALQAPAEAIYDLTQADVIVSLDADFLAAGPGALRQARDWASRRDADTAAGANMSRVYALEVTPTISGAVADHRVPVSTTQLDGFARALAASLGVSVEAGETSEVLSKWVQAITADIRSKGTRAVVIPGEFASANIHALAAAINTSLQSSAVRYTATAVRQAGAAGQRFAELITAMKAGQVQYLLMLGVDPAFASPEFAAELSKVPFSVSQGSYFQGTTKRALWALPDSHGLETWNDGYTAEGHGVIAQPLIAPLHDSKSHLETVMIVTRGARGNALEEIKTTWRTAGSLGEGFERAWRLALNNGIVPLTPTEITTKNASMVLTALAPVTGTEVVLRPDPTVFDGRFANNGWMQEMPKPLSTLTWDNVIYVSPKLAEAQSVRSGDVISVKVGEREVRGPAWVLPGQTENTVTVHYGYGNDGEGMMARGTGFNASALYSPATQFSGVSATISKPGGTVSLAATQLHNTMEGRDLVRVVAVGEAAHGEHDSGHGAEHGEGHGNESGATVDGKPWPLTSHDDQSMYYPEKEFANDLPQWGMSIDLNLCMGCHACVTACVAENNIAVVGKEQVIKQREMHWIRIDRYYGPKDTRTAFGQKVDLDNPSTTFMPVACMHCEQAPCEPVCPVAATIHSAEGLNQMVYNRCVGTRYCSNNCPYKVRRFNFLNYNDRKFTEYPEYKDLRVRLLVNNPNVTVRGRGVMEKCTYCVQRINDARQHAKVEFSKGRREVPEPKDGEVVTACQKACPTGAIVFGNIADAKSRVSQEKAKSRMYSLLEELNTRNRTTYLHAVRNPNPELENA